MKTYILSTGQITADEVKYVLDTIKVFLTIHRGDIPYNEWGNEMDLTSSDKEDILMEIRNALKAIITKLNNETYINTTLKSVEFDKTNNIGIRMTIDGVSWELYLNQL